MTEPTNEMANSAHEDEIQTIRQWIESEKKLNGRTDDAFILAFLRFSQFDIEKTKEKIKYFYTCRKKYPEWLKNHDPTSDAARKIWKHGFFLPITNQKYENQPSVMIIQAAGYDPRIIPLDCLANVGFSLGEHTLFKKENFQINGACLVVDMSEITARTIACFTIPVIRKFIDILFNAYPIDIAAVHFVKMPKIFEAILTVAMLFLPSYIKKRIHNHGHNFDSLHKHISPKFLASEYGGTNDTIEGLGDQLDHYMVSTKEYFDVDDNYGYIK